MFIFRHLNDIGRELKYGVFVLKPEEYFRMFYNVLRFLILCVF